MTAHIYTSIGIKVVNFPLVYALIDALGLGKDVQEAFRPTVPSEYAIDIADCHDSVLGNAYRFSGTSQSDFIY